MILTMASQQGMIGNDRYLLRHLHVTVSLRRDGLRDPFRSMQIIYPHSVWYNKYVRAFLWDSGVTKGELDPTRPSSLSHAGLEDDIHFYHPSG